MPCWKCDKQKPIPPMPPMPPVQKGVVNFCDVCDPCNPATSNVKLCAFVVPTLEEGRYFRNSFIFVQEDDSVYYISDDRSEIPFGSRPKFIDDFDPEKARFKSTVVYDTKNKMGYVYGPDGTYMSIPMSASPINALEAGTGILITDESGTYTISVDTDAIASKQELNTLAEAVELINNRVAGKQDALVAGANITINGNEISATDTTYSAFTGASASEAGAAGLVPAPAAGDNTKFLAGDGLWKTVSQYALPIASANELGGVKIGANLSIDAQGVLSADVSSYTAGANITINGTEISATDTTYSAFVGAQTSTGGTAGLVPAPLAGETNKYLRSNGTWSSLATVASTGSYADLSNQPTIPVITMTDTDPGEGQPLAANNFIAVY